MSDDGSTSKTRRPWIWVPPDIPGWSDLRQGGARRRAFIAYWRANGARWAFEYGLHRLFRLLPIDVVSGIGSLLGRRLGPKLSPGVAIRARQNLPRIHPDRDAASIEEAIAAYYDNAGRLLVEFAILGRLLRAGRIAVHGIEALDAARRAGPVIMIACHTGNWEVMFPLYRSIGFRPGIVLTPPPIHVRAHIAREVRLSFGADLLTPGKAGTREALRRLEAGGAVSIFCDEVHEGRLMAPFFDRPAHLDGNLAIALRLRRMTGARLVGYHCRRVDGARFEVRFAPIDDLPSASDPSASLLDDVKALEAHVAPIVRAAAEQWYFLDARFE